MIHEGNADRRAVQAPAGGSEQPHHPGRRRDPAGEGRLRDPRRDGERRRRGRLLLRVGAEHAALPLGGAGDQRQAREHHAPRVPRGRCRRAPEGPVPARRRLRARASSASSRPRARAATSRRAPRTPVSGGSPAAASASSRLSNISIRTTFPSRDGPHHREGWACPPRLRCPFRGRPSSPSRSSSRPPRRTPRARRGTRRTCSFHISQKARVPSMPRNGPGSGNQSRTTHSISGSSPSDRGIEVAAVERRVARRGRGRRVRSALVHRHVVPRAAARVDLPRAGDLLLLVVDHLEPL